MRAETPPFRAEHVGSLLRPPVLKKAYRAWTSGQLSDSGLREVQDRCIREVVALQEEVGLRSITDGELRRASYWSHFVEAVEGLTVKPARFRFHDESGQEEEEFLAPHVSGRVAWSRSLCGRELEFLASVTRETPKITLPSPPTMHFWRGSEGLDRRVYPEPELFFGDLAELYRRELGDLFSRGASYVQLDEVPLCMLCDPKVRERLAAAGQDPERLVELYLELIRASLSERPPEATVVMHLCRGNYKGLWLSEGGYELIAERLFREIPVDGFFLEYDSSRAGGFGPLELVPEPKRVVLGLVSTKTPELESADDLCRRIEKASRHLPLERLGVSPQCGFASTVGGNPLTWDDQRAKLALVVDVARRVWADE